MNIFLKMCILRLLFTADLEKVIRRVVLARKRLIEFSKSGCEAAVNSNILGIIGRKPDLKKDRQGEENAGKQNAAGI